MREETTNSCFSVSMKKANWLCWVLMAATGALLAGCAPVGTIPRGDPIPAVGLDGALETSMREAAIKRLNRLDRAEGLTVDASRGVLAPSSLGKEVLHSPTAQVVVPADGVLAFAVDVPETMYVSGSMVLQPDTDLRPGLRVTVLCDDVLVAAPMVSAPPWSDASKAQGTRPEAEVPLATWLLTRGRHVVSVVGPHFRPAGTFHRLAIRPTGEPAGRPLYRFAVISDTHVSLPDTKRTVWWNVKMMDVAAPTLRDTLQRLQTEGVDFVLLPGDMTDRSAKREFEILMEVVRGVSIPVYGCFGNHDVYGQDDSRRTAIQWMQWKPSMFPDGKPQYVFHKPPLRFVVLDWPSQTPEQLAWLSSILQADGDTPTVVVAHNTFYNRSGVTISGFLKPVYSESNWAMEPVRKLLLSRPNVVASLNGHGHFNEVNRLENVTFVQNAAFCEWPNMYRIFRVYADRLEWEVRQVTDRKFVRESFLLPEARTWMIQTGEEDLTGRIPLDRKEDPPASAMTHLNVSKTPSPR